MDRTVAAAAAAYPEWRSTPPGERIQYLFKLKALLERETQEIGRTITIENGKILSESLGELTRAIENVEVACGIPMMMQGDVLEDVSRGIDELMIRQPVGVCAIICPFNFPAMIPFWFFPYALACGNVVIVKPADRTPNTMQVVTRLIEEAGLPPGVFNVVNGGADTVNAPARPSRRARGELRRLHYRRPARLRPRLRGRQARAGAGRRQEPDHRAARRRDRHGHPDHRRLPVTAMPASAVWPPPWPLP